MWRTYSAEVRQYLTLFAQSRPRINQTGSVRTNFVRTKPAHDQPGRFWANKLDMFAPRSSMFFTCPPYLCITFFQ